MGIVIRGKIPEGWDELGLTRLVRLALAVGVGSSFNSILTQIEGYSDQATVSQENMGDDRLHRLNFLIGLVRRDLDCLIEDGVEFEEEVNLLLDHFGLEYEQTAEG